MVMSEVLKEGLMIVGSYIGVIAIGFALVNFLSGGFLIKFLKVRASRGKLIMIRVKSTPDSYYKTGQITERTLRYTARGQKETKPIIIPKDITPIYRSMNVWCIDVDEETNAIIMPDGKTVDTYDAEKYEQLIMRALYKPALMDKNEKIMLLMIGACILGLVIVFFYVKQIDGNIFAMQQTIASLKEIATNSVAVVG
jgi:hypothetical protein